MEVYTSTACVTILCIIATISAQGIPDTGSHGNTGSSGPMESSTPLRCGNESHISSGSSCCNDTLNLGLSHLVADCCGSEAFNPLNEFCCDGSVFIRTRANMTCNTGKDRLRVKNGAVPSIMDLTGMVQHTDSGSNMYGRTIPGAIYNIGVFKTTYRRELKCGSETYNPKEKLCCSGELYQASAINKCCGEDMYRLGDDDLCCNGTIHRNVHKQAECVAGVLYSPDTCNLPARARLGEHCCGGKTFNPVTHICCNGHSHLKTNGNFCCGSDVYDHHKKFMKCCSGHLYNVTNNKGEAECCGNLLLENKTNQICCSSSNHAILYNTKPNHHCCGHYYYNTSLWSCCAQRLKPTPSPNGSHAEEGLKPLVDLIPDICNKTVFFGKVESVALDPSKRHIVLKVINVIEDPWLNVSLDHCISPVLENGMTYLWEKNGNVYKPLSISSDPISDIHMFFTVCNHKCQKGG